MVIHISRKRFDAIRAMGQQYELRDLVLEANISEKLNEYHILPEEAGFCPDCSLETHSVDASSPVELEMVKFIGSNREVLP